jgi:DnaJ family protein A protein 2
MHFFPFGFDDDDFGGGFSSGFGKPKPKKDVDTTKYYKILGVDKNASKDEIKKAYRTLVRTKHPDKGGSEQEFQEIQLAYDTLSDENKRKVYDEYGEEGIKEGMTGEEPRDIFDLFTGGRGGKNVKRKTKSVLQEMVVSLEDIFVGKEKYLEIKRYRICKKCRGNGSKDPNANTKCPGCNGKRVKLVVQRMGNTILQSQQTCPDCRGEGYIIKNEDKCEACNGQKVNQESKMLKILLDKGAPDGKRYTFEGESDEMPGYDPGDVIIEIRIKKHDVFERSGADLTMKADISLLEALTGFQLLITHLDGRKVLINSKKGEIIKPGMMKTVKECGMPFYDHPTRFGNLYIRFNVHFPKSLKEAQKDALQHLFPKISVHIKDIDKIKEKYKMTEYKENMTNTYATGGNRPDESEEEERPRQQVSCANQ